MIRSLNIVGQAAHCQVRLLVGVWHVAGPFCVFHVFFCVFM